MTKLASDNGDIRIIKVRIIKVILGDPGADCEGKGSLNEPKKMATKKSIVGQEEPLGTRSYQTSSKQSG